MNAIDLKGRVAVVTGGAQGIGLCVARRFIASGATVSLWDRDAAQLEVALADLNGAATAQTVDVVDWDTVARATEAVAALNGRLDILVNSAGIAGKNAPLDDYEIDEWRRVIDIDLTGTFLVNRAVIPHMKAQNYGRIVNIASVAGKEGNPNASAYAAAKAGVIGMTKAVGKELAEYDIAVNAITPATAKTAILDELKPEFIDYMLSKIPRGRFAEVEEIAGMVSWLVSQENSFTTASVFDLSGGRATY
ncbi:SDR family NAD(P)-dependent oxidoreductase [Roseisalinus antarcticus]|uniref:3-oxoacyl-[acyl-carrier-protein] reductase FabG n=1 Tax=Roseisalinus antarcticus TaxID=254357 RepID=A0A1Y5TWF8_9RHOB|nr:SDR family NAD(P)-dependent oxidoreductase [Roseisalinus antarcticus]SLN75368.1 3-oxoacyl-[acyl-carrier-protein] reductase FabG [Roseisalinus antarcticus]